MTNQMVRIFLVGLYLLPFLSHAASRELALKPHLERLSARWKELPADYQREKRRALEDYLALFTTTNGYAWNDQWTAFTARMGPEFRPFYADVIEVMKIAEAYEAGFPNPEEKLPAVADAIFEKVPINALLFIQSDLFESILTLGQQHGKRRDVLVLNSSRVMDVSYLEIALARHRSELEMIPAEFGKRVFEEALRRKQEGDDEFRDLEIVGGRVRAEGVQLVTSLNRLTMREISGAMPGRAALFLPLLQEGGTVAGWVTLTNSGIFFSLVPGTATPERSSLSDWEAVLDQAAPLHRTLHAEMAKAIGQSIAAIAAIRNAQGQNEVSIKLLHLWDQRLRGVTVIGSRDIRIDENGKMVQQKRSTEQP